jgi:hypothetical protein
MSSSTEPDLAHQPCRETIVVDQHQAALQLQGGVVVKT